MTTAPDDPSRERPASRVVLANAGAGSTETEAVATAVAALAADAPVRLVWTEEPDDFVATVRDLGDDEQLVVAGGDGSIHLALETVTDLNRTDRPVGIIPLGTGNDFARNHGIPLDPDEAAGVVISGTPTSVDAMDLECDDGGTGLVANNIHVGLGVRAAQTAADLKPKLGRFAYPVGTAYQGVRGEPVDLLVTADDHTLHDGPLLAVLVLLGPSMGGGVEVTDEDPSRIDLVLVEPADAGERVGLVVAALRSRIFDADRAQRHRVGTVTIDGRGAVDVNIDGEMITYAERITLRHHPAAWTVMLPPA